MRCRQYRKRFIRRCKQCRGRCRKGVAEDVEEGVEKM